MRAIRIHKTGGPEVLQLDDVELAAPGPGQAQVQNHAVGVNYLDIYHRTGLYPVPLPMIPGCEGAGEVTAVGSGVDGFKAGDRVAYSTTPGSYAQARNVDVKHLVHMPDSVSYDQAAAMMLKGLTAQYLLRQTYRVQTGDTILVHAAAGGVGQILCQWGKHLGATVIGTVGSPAKADIAKRVRGRSRHQLCGTEDFAVARRRGHRRAPNALLSTTASARRPSPASLDCLRPFGVFASFGSASGPLDAFNLSVLGQKGSLFATRPTLFTFMADRARLETMAQGAVRGRRVSGVGQSRNLRARAARRGVARVHRELEAPAHDRLRSC